MHRWWRVLRSPGPARRSGCQRSLFELEVKVEELPAKRSMLMCSCRRQRLAGVLAVLVVSARVFQNFFGLVRPPLRSNVGHSILARQRT